MSPFKKLICVQLTETKNYEWYDPAGVTTRDGALSITLTQHPDHNLNFRGGMIQSWNKFCFTGGLVVVKVRLPGQPRVGGLWPAIWMMGNLGRAGYGASLEGTWPYTYDSCDAGTMANQTDPATGMSFCYVSSHGADTDDFCLYLSYCNVIRFQVCPTRLPSETAPSTANSILRHSASFLGRSYQLVPALVRITQARNGKTGASRAGPPLSSTSSKRKLVAHSE